MKTSIDLPDELYRRVKARSAMEGRAVREVATELLTEWLDRKPSPASARAATSSPPTPTRDWLYEWAALGARIAKGTTPRATATKRVGASSKGAKKKPSTGLVDQLTRDRR
jgi:plasmid stability protein